MKRQLKWIAFLTTLIIGSIVPGCGGGGGGGDDSNGSGGNQSGLAPQAATGKSVFVQPENQAVQELRFATAGNSYTVFAADGSVVSSGTYQYSASGNTATLVTTEQASNTTTTFHLTFSSASAGTFTYSTSAGAAGNGTFDRFDTTTAQNPGGGPEPGGDNGGGNPPPGTGTGGLDGKVLLLTRSSGQTHTYTFTSTGFVDSDPPEEGAGTYTYSRNGSEATLKLTYTAASKSKSLAGDQHDIRLTFQTETSGTYISTYLRNDGVDLPQNGTFQFQ